MNKQTVFGVLGLLALIAAVAMNRIGKSSSHLSELKDYWWIPLPLALLFFVAAASKKKQ